MFLEKLNTISSRISGALALSLVDGDGITIESVSSDPSIDLEALAAEMVIQHRAMTENHRELSGGTVRLLSLTTTEVTIMVSLIVRDYYLLLVLGREGSQGQARFELRRAELLLADDF